MSWRKILCRPPPADSPRAKSIKAAAIQNTASVTQVTARPFTLRRRIRIRS